MDTCIVNMKYLSPFGKFLRRRVPSLLVIAAYHAMSLLDVYAPNANYGEEQFAAIRRIDELLMQRLCDIYADLAGMFRKLNSLENEETMWLMISSASYQSLVDPYLQACLLSSSLLVSLMERLVFSEEAVIRFLPCFVALVVIKVQLEETLVSEKMSVISRACLLLRKSLDHHLYSRTMTLSALLLRNSPFARFLTGVDASLDVGEVQGLPIRWMPVNIKGQTIYPDEELPLARHTLLFAIRVSDRRLVRKLTTMYPNLARSTHALHESLELHDVGMCKILIEQEEPYGRRFVVDLLNNPCSFGTPLMTLCRTHYGKSNHTGMVLFRSLVSKGASMNKVDALGKTVLDICQSSGCDDAFTGFVRTLWYRRTLCTDLATNLRIHDDLSEISEEDYEFVEENVRKEFVYSHKCFGRLMRGIRPVYTPPPRSHENPNNAIAQQIINLPAEDFFIPDRK